MFKKVLIANRGESEGKEIHLDKIKNSTDSRVLINTYRVSPIYTFDIYEAYRVKDNIYNENNWEKLDSSQIKDLYK